MRSLTLVRDDKYVILKGFALKNLPPSESTIATVTNRTVEIPHTRPQVSVRNDIIVILTTVGRKNLKRNGHFSGDSSLLLGITTGFHLRSERLYAKCWRISPHSTRKRNLMEKKICPHLSGCPLLGMTTAAEGGRLEIYKEIPTFALSADRLG